MKSATFPFGGCGYALPSPSPSSSSLKIVIIMAKSSKNSPTSSPKDSDPTPPRILSNVKQNLQFLKLWKVGDKFVYLKPILEFIFYLIQGSCCRSSKKGSLARPSLLRVTAGKESRRRNFLKILSSIAILPQPFTSNLLSSTNQGIVDAVPVLLVDGYNVCGYWPKLKKHFMKGRLDVARQKLIDELITFSMLREVKVVVVFDAMLSGLPTHKESFAGRTNCKAFFIQCDFVVNFALIDIVFSGETCADSWIEKEIVALKEDGCPRVWVVTSDHCHQHAAHGAGAFVWSCKALVSEIKTSQKEVEMMFREQRSTSFQGRLLKHNLDSEVVGALKDMRNKLSENESNSK
ncbi:hypothetical protein Patl1_32741 [Pistacia atlantica]|uniref:Uncharacterized protein n=1 Tax=Pistacia atlantica TaxID=434234 RepID=A0ACC1AM15_9ROSI|nr:hypothetical protein Patl1_32741 [Pistacia atlantica]